MNVLVGYATAHGSTEGIAREVGERLTASGLVADVLPVDRIEAVDSYDAVVLGSAIHDGAWLPHATAFVWSHAAELGQRPVWLFSVSSVGDTTSFLHPWVASLMRRIRKEPRDIARFRRSIRVRGHRSFAGAVERTHWGLAGHLFLKAMGGSYGDHRDWLDLDTWADGIAHELLPVDAGA